MSMKLLTLPVCPHCGTKYGYKETSEMKSGVQNCYYCKKKFVPQKNKQEAANYILDNLKESVDAVFASLMETFHSWAQYMK